MMMMKTADRTNANMVYEESQNDVSSGYGRDTPLNNAAENGNNLPNMNPPPMNPGAQYAATSLPPQGNGGSMDPRMYQGIPSRVRPLRPSFPPNAVLLSVAGFSGDCEVCQCACNTGLLCEGSRATASPLPTQLVGLMSGEQYKNAVELLTRQAERYIRPQVIYIVWIFVFLVPFIGTVVAWGMAESDKEERDEAYKRGPYYTSIYSYVTWGCFVFAMCFNMYASFVVNANVDQALETACRDITQGSSETVWTFASNPLTWAVTLTGSPFGLHHHSQWFEGCGRPGRCVSITVRGANDSPSLHQVTIPVRPMLPGWEERVDSSTGKTFYANVVTGQTMAVRPYR